MVFQCSLYLAGVTIWNYFSETLSKTATVFKDNAQMLGKIYFPRLTMPMSIVISNLIRFLIQFGLFIVVCVYFIFQKAPVSPNIYILLTPMLILMMGILALGFGMIISALTTKYRDLIYLLTFGIQLLMFATPVIYSLENVPARFRWLILANPMSSIVEVFRYAFLGTGMFNWNYLIYSFIASLIILFIGTIVFNKVKKFHRYSMNNTAIKIDLLVAGLELVVRLALAVWGHPQLVSPNAVVPSARRIFANTPFVTSIAGSSPCRSLYAITRRPYYGAMDADRRLGLVLVLAVASCLPGLACAGSSSQDASSDLPHAGGQTLATRLAGDEAVLRGSLRDWRASDPGLLEPPPRAALAAAALSWNQAPTAAPTDPIVAMTSNVASHGPISTSNQRCATGTRRAPGGTAAARRPGQEPGGAYSAWRAGTSCACSTAGWRRRGRPRGGVVSRWPCRMPPASRHSPDWTPVMVPLELRFHCWLAWPLQSQMMTAVPLLVPWPLASRHLLPYTVSCGWRCRSSAGWCHRGSPTAAGWAPLVVLELGMSMQRPDWLPAIRTFCRPGGGVTGGRSGGRRRCDAELGEELPHLLLDPAPRAALTAGAPVHRALLVAAVERGPDHRVSGPAAE